MMPGISDVAAHGRSGRVRETIARLGAFVSAIALLAGVILAPSALASSPGTGGNWSQLTSANLPILTQPGLFVSGGTATVAWAYPPSATSLDTKIAIESFKVEAAKKLGSTSPRLVTATSTSIGSAVSLVAGTGGALDLVYNDLSGTFLETRAAGGAFSGPTQIGSPYSGTPSALDAGGTLLVAEDGLLLHGLTPSQSGVDYQQNLLGGCCGSEPTLGRDHSGRVWLAWYSDATGAGGIYLVQVNPTTGSPIGKATSVPNSYLGDWNAQNRINLVCAATCRVVYWSITQTNNAQPTPHVMSWALGSKPVQIAQLTPTLLSLPSLAATYRSDGKLAIAWYDRKGGSPAQGYYAELGNATGTGGKPIFLGQPSTAVIGTYTLEAASSGTNVVFLTIAGATSGASTAGWVDVVG
jgi:hypothetical protein